MLRNVFCAAAALVLCVGITLADEIRGVITKVEGNKVTFAPVKGKGGERGESKTLPVADNVKVSKGKFNREAKKLEAGEALADGLKGKAFSNIGEKGVRATIVTNADNTKITEIVVAGLRKKN